jgi:hypothetical protein
MDWGAKVTSTVQVSLKKSVLPAHPLFEKLKSGLLPSETPTVMAESVLLVKVAVWGALVVLTVWSPKARVGVAVCALTVESWLSPRPSSNKRVNPKLRDR